METNKDFARRYVVPQGRTLTVNITGFQALGFVDGRAVDIEVDPSDPAHPTLVIRLADGPDAQARRMMEISHEARHNLPPGAARHIEPSIPVEVSPTYRYVVAFGRIMEMKLQKNRHKGDRNGWSAADPVALLGRVKQELTELLVAVFHGESDEAVAKEAADVGNMAMMVADAYIHQHSMGAASIIDLQPEEWTVAPLHGGVQTYRKEMDRIASVIEAERGPKWLADQLRELGPALVAYVEGL